MASDGKQLEGLIAFVENTMLPHGFEVKTNKRVYNDEGIQIAEFDIEIRGKVGSTSIAWLIECRDRPGQGPAPGSWIEQLIGRRLRFNFNKITAVSTTGFSVGAVEFAENQGIELREVASLSADEFSDWLIIRHIHQIERVYRLNHALLLIHADESEDRRNALLGRIADLEGDERFLRSSKTGEPVSASTAFLNAAQGNLSLFDGLEANGEGRSVQLHVQYKNDEDYLFVETPLGQIRIEAILFFGQISIRENPIPLDYTAEYRQLGTGEPISQVASFEAQKFHGIEFSLEMHRMAESGKTHVILRNLCSIANTPKILDKIRFIATIGQKTPDGLKSENSPIQEVAREIRILRNE
jgi:hypothetical protein